MQTLNLPHEDPLGVLTSTRRVVERAQHVRINQDAIAKLASDLGPLMNEAPNWHDARHYSDFTWKTAAWVLVLDALNFCFWSQYPNPKDRWQVDWDGRIENGYWALASALNRAMAEGREIWNPNYLVNLTPRDVAHILRPAREEGPEIPLLPLRVQNLHELGVGLLAMDPAINPVVGLIRGSQESAVSLVQEVVRRFPSFNDVAEYEGEEVRFYKRAQILVADLHGAFNGNTLGQFHDMHLLTAFADYKVPQVLNAFDALVYTPDLTEAIASRTLIPTGSPWEVEIRAATVWACELLRQELARQARLVRATEVDWILWLAGQSLPAQMPTYHRTYTVFY